jgi:23S rRNA (pseudouridine1915-N3)-methyltransferase
MKLRIVALGHKPPAWAAEAYADYARRLPREFPLELVEVKPEPRNRGRTATQLLDSEANRIETAARGFEVVALDQKGAAWTTLELASALKRWRERAAAIAFVIGSADGLAERVKRDAGVIVSLSALTLPHGLVRVLLAEQIYRAVSVLQGHPYHRE